MIDSPFLDAQSATTWYMGNFPMQFIYREVMKLGVMENRSELAQFMSDTVAMFKVRFKGSTESLDYRKAVKNTA